MKNQSGFTLIELVIVIVLLGVLSAIAVPRFVNLEDDAQRVTLSATAASLTSAMNINYAECAVNNFSTVAPSQCRPVSTCQGATGADQVVQGTALSTYTIAALTIPAGNGTIATCSITKNGYTGPGSPASFTAVRTGP